MVAMKQRRILHALIFTCLISLSAHPIFASEKISEYTLQRLRDFTALRAEFSSQKQAKDVMDKLKDFEDMTFAQLEKEALDYEQEKLILESYIMMERFVHVFNEPDTNLKDVRLKLKEMMKKNENWISQYGKKNGTNAWMYVMTGDVTSCYMTFSIASTMVHGMRVKNLYEMAVKANPCQWNANIDLGQWLFYAPGIFGGSKKKAGEMFKSAVEGADTDSEKYYAYIYYSQFLFENNKKEQASEILAKADEIIPGSFYVQNVRSMNENNSSLFTANRNRSGVDSNTDPNAKEL